MSSALTGGSPNALSFWTYAGNDAILMPALEAALWRIRNATCLPVDVSLDAHFWVRQWPAEDMPEGWTGWTVGGGGPPWTNSRIRVIDTADVDHAERIIVHEIAEHILRRSNSHATAAGQGSSTLTEALVTSICEVRVCGCFNPEH